MNFTLKKQVGRVQHTGLGCRHPAAGQPWEVAGACSAAPPERGLEPPPQRGLERFAGEEAHSEEDAREGRDLRAQLGLA